MKNKSAAIIALLAVLAFCSCASMYIKPSIQTTLYKQQIPGQAAFLFKTALYVIPAMGYKIDGSDSANNTITTSPIEITLDPSMCDCGSSMGLPIVKSRGTKGKVYFIIGVANNELTIKSEIVPVLTDLMSTLSTVADIACISKGKLEETLARNFLQKMKPDVLKLLFK